jgi:hypothetical protein
MASLDLITAIFVLEKVVRDSPANGHARILLLRPYRLACECATRKIREELTRLSASCAFPPSTTRAATQDADISAGYRTSHGHRAKFDRLCRRRRERTRNDQQASVEFQGNLREHGARSQSYLYQEDILLVSDSLIQISAAMVSAYTAGSYSQVRRPYPERVFAHKSAFRYLECSS